MLFCVCMSVSVCVERVKLSQCAQGEVTPKQNVSQCSLLLSVHTTWRGGALLSVSTTNIQINKLLMKPKSILYYSSCISYTFYS